MTSKPLEDLNLYPWIRAQEWILRAEGGFSDHSWDPGEKTKYGISEKSYPDLDIQNLTKEQALEIYKKDYWEASGASRLPLILGLAVFDCAVVQGVGTAKELLQRLVGTEVDGVIGPKTLAAASKKANRHGLERYCELRWRRFQKAPAAPVALPGWTFRLFRLMAECWDFKECA